MRTKRLANNRHFEVLFYEKECCEKFCQNLKIQFEIQFSLIFFLSAPSQKKRKDVLWENLGWSDFLEK